MDVHEQQIERN